MTTGPSFFVITQERDEAMRRLALAVTEVVRLREEMNKYSEDETLGGFRGEVLLKRCIEICQEESTDNGTAQKIEARIRALKRDVRAVRNGIKRSE